MQTAGLADVRLQCRMMFFVCSAWHGLVLEVEGFQVRGGGWVNRAPKIWGGGWEKGSIDRHHSCMEKRHRFVSCSCLPTMGDPKKPR